MTFFGYLVYALVTLITFVIGLDAFGYSNPWGLSAQVLALLAIAWLLIGCVNELIFRIKLEDLSNVTAHSYHIKKFPPPRKYGYKFDDPELEPWFGQTYLEDLCADSSLDEISRLEAKILVNDIHKAEWLDWALERRLMRVALEAMKKYDKMVLQDNA